MRYAMSRFIEHFSDLQLSVEWWSDRAVRVVKNPPSTSPVPTTSVPNDWDIIKAPGASPADIPVRRSENTPDDNVGEIHLAGAKTIVVIRYEIPSHRFLSLKVLGARPVQDNGSSIPGASLVEEGPHHWDVHGEPGSGKPLKISQSFHITLEEGIFGLGQHRIAKTNWRDVHLDLGQKNTFVTVPFLISTKGYGIMWEQTARSEYDAKGDQITFTTDRASTIAYWILVGGTFDELIRQYRQLTGKAPILPRWAYGFIQSRNRYWTRDEVMGVVKRHRAKHLPIDVIVIDYVYYGHWGVGSHRFDEDAYPDPAGMIQEFHDTHHVKLLLSIWPTFSPDADTFPAMRDHGYLLDCAAKRDRFYDPFNEVAGKAFWKLLQDRLFVAGVDAWWLDASEPDDPVGFRTASTAWGPGADHANVYSLLHTKHVHDGQRNAAPGQRVFVLTRSAFLGQQRHAAATWSGDILPTWEEFQKQVASGLNFCAAGIPYWCTDIGGYRGGWARDPWYRELFVRWFQWGAFCPIFRSHGRRYPRNRKGKNEIWAFGRRATRIMREFLNLRYRLMPYIYSSAGKVYHEDDTMMRLLAFEYPLDPAVHGITDQFFFGHALMVCPVTSPRKRSRQVYLPAGTWWDFWTGERFTGPCTRTMPAPLDRIPILVKAGTILPLAPVMQYTTEKPWNPLELRVYPGADGEASIYFDNGLDYGYEHGESQWLSISWSERDGSISFHVCEGTRVRDIPLQEIRVAVVHKPTVAKIPDIVIDFADLKDQLARAPFTATRQC
jgi:alpha-D-xyloside xylohydrolase